MRMWRIVLLFVMGCAAPAATVKSTGGTGLDRALVGEWGVLEYRDDAEAAESTKRVRLPTWLAIERDGDHQRWHYTYVDGPGKTVEETDLVTIARDSYSEHELGKPAHSYGGLGDRRATRRPRDPRTSGSPSPSRVTRSRSSRTPD